MTLAINTDNHYHQAMAAIETYLSKGSDTLTDSDLAELQRLSLLVKKYEDIHYPMPVEPNTMPEMI